MATSGRVYRTSQQTCEEGGREGGIPTERGIIPNGMEMKFLAVSLSNFSMHHCLLYDPAPQLNKKYGIFFGNMN